MSEQRIVKAVSGEAAIHYHYDGEGRLIAETDAATGETLREYVWLGLPLPWPSPPKIDFQDRFSRSIFSRYANIASYGAANDNTPTEPVDCDVEEIEALQALLASAQEDLSLLQSDLAEHEDTRIFRLERIAQMEADLETLSGKKAEKLADKIAKWEPFNMVSALKGTPKRCLYLSLWLLNG